jgi:hypothetical protein
MADYTVASQIKPPQQMSLGDIMNFARGAQAYQQAQQMNPLQLQQEQIKTAQAQQENDERLKVQDYLSNPDQNGWIKDDGTPDYIKMMRDINKMAPYTGMKWIQNAATTGEASQKAMTAQTGAQSAQLALNNKKMGLIGNSAIAFMNDPDIVDAEKNPQTLSEEQKQRIGLKIISNGTNTARALGIPDEQAASLMQPYVEAFENNPQGFRGYLKTRLVQGIDDAASEVNALNPKAVAQQWGSGGQLTSTSEFGATSAGNALPNTEYTEGSAPSWQTDYRGLPTLQRGMSGGIRGPISIAPKTAPAAGENAAPVTAPAATAAPATTMPGQPNQPKKAAGGVKPLQPFNGEPVDAYRKRQADVSALGTNAMNDIDATKQDSASNMLEVNNRVLHLLEGGKVDVGPIAQWIAGKTQGISLSADQQEIAKYLAQRTTQMSAQNKEQMGQQQTAFGNFGTNADALKEIILKDRGMLMGNQIHANGVLKARGDAGNPNQNAMYQYDQNFKSMATPRLLQYISIVGDQPNAKTKFTNGEINSLRKNFTNISPSQLDDLEKQRQNLLNLTGK